VAPMKNDNAELRRALKRSLRLQAHYAMLLNMYDGGQRMIFTGIDQWLARLREVDERVRTAAATLGEDEPREERATSDPQAVQAEPETP
jgi:hypothetical protein